MGVLDMIHGYDDVEKFLDKQKSLGEDLLALKRASKIWKTNKAVDVGESGTLFRFLQFASWKLNLNKKFIKRGTLLYRKVCNNPEIINWDLNRLLKLDGGTSQWASASVLLGNTGKVKNLPYFLEKTLEALKYWQERRKKAKKWEAKYDEILLKQATHFINVLRSKNSAFTPLEAERSAARCVDECSSVSAKTGFNVSCELLTGFTPTNPDDYCFARAFGIVSRVYGEKHWPMIKHHESNRLEEMEAALLLAEKNKMVSSKDHRVIQAIAMLYKTKRKKVKFKYPKSVNKSWPQFWNFLKI